MSKKHKVALTDKELEILIMLMEKHAAWLRYNVPVGVAISWGIDLKNVIDQREYLYPKPTHPTQ